MTPLYTFFQGSKTYSGYFEGTITMLASKNLPVYSAMREKKHERSMRDLYKIRRYRKTVAGLSAACTMNYMGASILTEN